MKRLILSAALCLLALLLCGCDATELGGRALIQAAAVDISDGEYTVSALLFSSSGGSGGEIDPSNDNVIKVTGTGRTFSEAVDNISLTDGKEIFMSENKLLIIGAGFRREELTPLLLTAARDMRCSLNMMVCFSEDPELLTDLHFTEGITAAEKPVSMIENAYRAGSSPRAYLLDLLNDARAGRDSLIPMFSPARNGYGTTTDEDGETVILSGAAVMSRGLLTDSLDPEQTAGRMLLDGLSDRVLLTFLLDGNEYSCEAYNVSAERLGDGRVKLKAGLRQRNGAQLTEDMKRAASQELDRIINAALS